MMNYAIFKQRNVLPTYIHFIILRKLLFIHLFIYLLIYLFVHLFICLLFYLFFYFQIQAYEHTFPKLKFREQWHLNFLEYFKSQPLPFYGRDDTN